MITQFAILSIFIPLPFISYAIEMMRWGTGDGINPMDLINPRDYRDPIASARTDGRLPIFLANGIFLLGPVTLVQGCRVCLPGLCCMERL